VRQGFHCPLALASAISFLMAAGLLGEHGGVFGLIGACGCIYLALLMLRERDALLVETTLDQYEAAIVEEARLRGFEP
jgi:hypothetical protein